MTSTGKVIRGTFDNQTNNIEGFGGLGAAANTKLKQRDIGKPTNAW